MRLYLMLYQLASSPTSVSYEDSHARFHFFFIMSFAPGARLMRSAAFDRPVALLPRLLPGPFERPPFDRAHKKRLCPQAQSAWRGGATPYAPDRRFLCAVERRIKRETARGGAWTGGPPDDRKPRSS